MVTEKQLAKAVVAWLTEQHYPVYQEVQVRRYGAVADLVADVNGRGRTG
jgi:hypothetical protein